MRPGIDLLEETIGSGAAINRHQFYQFRIKIWLRRGDPVVWAEPWGVVERATIEDEGTTLVTVLRVDREYMFSGLFYAVQGMRVGGSRTVRVAPHLAYGEKGVPGSIPPHALLNVRVDVLEQHAMNAYRNST
ncbi:MAG: FKBP-type peptidyl-prolyl cis-trans isomerase [Myxococcota bacterium]